MSVVDASSAVFINFVDASKKTKKTGKILSIGEAQVKLLPVAKILL